MAQLFSLGHIHTTMKKSTYLVGLCVSIMFALAGIYISFQGFELTWGTLFSLTKHDKLPDGVDSMVKTGLSSSEQMFILLFVGFTVVLVLNSYLLFRTLRQRKDDHVA
jgi:hypothetical protein